jgi:hypothetical protein
VALLSRAAAVRVVQQVVPTRPDAEAGRLAAAVEDLPLALAQAAGLPADTGMTVAEYLPEPSASDGSGARWSWPL